MTYWALNAFFLAAVALVALAAALKGRAGRTTADPRRSDAGPRWTAVGLAAIALLIATAVFDNVMIRIGLVAYNPDLISGAFVGIAPLEDFAYAIAAVVLLPSLWHLLPRTAPSTGSGTGRGSGPSTGSGTAAGGTRA
jgi:lycopene cyclase domain-containing protein